MPPSLPPPPFFSLLFLLLLLTASTAHSQTSRRLLQSTLPPPPPPHHHHHHTPRSPPPSPPQLNPAPPTPTPPKQTPAVSIPPASAPPPTPIPTPPPPPPTPTSTSSATPTPDAYPFTNYPFFPSASPPPPFPEQQSQPSADASRTFPANITNLVAPNSPTPSGSPRRFPLFQALLLAFLSLFLLLLSVLLSVLLFRRIRPAHHAANGPASSHSAASSARRDDDDGEEGDDEGRSLKPPPMPTSSTNPSTEFLYLGTLASSATPPPPSTHLRPGSPELRPLPPLPRTGPPSGEFFASRSPTSTAALLAGANPSSSWLSPSSPSASSPTLGSSPAHVHVHARPPSIPQPRGRAPNPSRPKRRPSPPHHSWNPFAPAPPPPRASPSDDDDDDGGESYTTDMRKSRPLHADKLKPGPLHMKDEMIQLYLNNTAAAAREVCLLGATRCRGIGMVLGALGVSEEQVRDALLEGNAHGLGVEALRMLAQLVPTNEEELKLRYFKDDPPAKLCKVDAFLKTILDVPFAFKRVDAMLYVSNFYLEVNQLRMSYATLEAACQELRSSRLFHRVLGAVLNFGNLMSINTGSPNSHALEPNTLLKIVDVKGADGKAVLLHFVVQEIVKPEGHNSQNTMHSGSAACKTNVGTLPYDVNCRKHGLQVVSTLAAGLTSTKKAASIDITSLSKTVSELGAGLGKIHNVLRLNSMVAEAESARRFHGAMGTFLRQAEEEILELQAQESVCLSSVKEMAEYFHGDDSASRDEGRMFRIFAGVREFIAMLDRICREAGEINGDRVGSTQTVSRMAAAPMGMTMATP